MVRDRVQYAQCTDCDTEGRHYSGLRARMAANRSPANSLGVGLKLIPPIKRLRFTIPLSLARGRGDKKDSERATLTPSRPWGRAGERGELCTGNARMICMRSRSPIDCAARIFAEHLGSGVFAWSVSGLHPIHSHIHAEAWRDGTPLNVRMNSHLQRRHDTVRSAIRSWLPSCAYRRSDRADPVCDHGPRVRARSNLLNRGEVRRRDCLSSIFWCPDLEQSP